MSNFILSVSIAIIGIAALLYRILRPKDSHASLSIFVYSSFLILLSFVLLYHYAKLYFSAPWLYFLDLRYSEFNHSSSFSSLLLFVAGASALSLGLFSPKAVLWERLYYLLLSLCFVFLASDEYFMIHETLNNWALLYSSSALVMAFLGTLVFWHSRPAHGLILYLALFGGLAVAAVGSIGVEEFFGRNCFALLSHADCLDVPVIEELLETLGYIFAAAATLQLILQSQERQGFVIWASAAWLAFVIFSFWLQPTLENSLIAESLDVHFEAANLLLIGQHLNQTRFRAGETLSLGLYWQATAIESHDFGYTINLLDPVSGESLWRENLNIAYPSTKSWFVGVTYRSHYSFLIPETIDTPVNAILTVGVWRKEGETYLNDQGESAAVEIFAGEFPVVSRIALLSPIEHNLQATYRFENGIRLALPEFVRETERHYRMHLRWSAEVVALDDKLNYFIHFLQEDGDTNFVFDRPPFENRFPTNAWTLEMNELDEFELELPEEAVGRYQLVIGLLRTNSGERIPVEDMQGEFLPDQSIPIQVVEER